MPSIHHDLTPVFLLVDFCFQIPFLEEFLVFCPFSFFPLHFSVHNYPQLGELSPSEEQLIDFQA